MEYVAPPTSVVGWPIRDDEARVVRGDAPDAPDAANAGRHPEPGGEHGGDVVEGLQRRQELRPALKAECGHLLSKGCGSFLNCGHMLFFCYGATT